MINDCPAYLRHYIDLDRKYNSQNDIFFEYVNALKRRITDRATADSSYKYYIYKQINPTLDPYRGMHDISFVVPYIVRFRLGSHNLPIETGRWSRKSREERLCPTCNILGDEEHMLFDCVDINRSNLILERSLSKIWECDDVKILFTRIVELGTVL